MDLLLSRKDAEDIDADVVIVAVPERTDPATPFPKALAAEDATLQGTLRAMWERKEIRGKRGEVHLVSQPIGGHRVLVVGLGPKESYSAEAVRQAAAFATKGLRGKAVRSAVVRLASFAHSGVDAPTAAAAFGDGAVLTSYEFAHFKSEPGPVPYETLTLSLGAPLARGEAGVKKALARQKALTEATVWARDIGNLPANIATPGFLAEKAQALAEEVGLKVTVFDESQLQAMGCGGILAVGGGSSHPPRLIILEYAGRRAAKGKTIAVVGKGITFDSGGISIKPAAAMGEMKYDKSGAVAVLGILRAAAALKVAPKVIGVMSCAENLPSSTSYRPGDVVRTYSGKTIEVLNTDAEGRVVLSDALAYVKATYKPDEIIDLATLTGACVVALGVDMAGLMSTSEPLAKGLLKASEATGEKIWRLPITATHREMVKSQIADVRNSCEMPPAGALTAGAFLQTFVGDTPWAHLDIAGTAWVPAVGGAYSPPYHTQGYTGFGVRLVASYLADRT